MTSTQDILTWADDCIAKKGWAAISVFEDPETGEPPFTYSVGFSETLDCPEVVLVGFHPETAQSVIGAFHDAVSEGRIKLDFAAADHSQVIQDFDVRVQPVADDIADRIGRVLAARGIDPIRMLHAMLPDMAGKLPGDPECDPHFATGQDIGQLRDRSQDV